MVASYCRYITGKLSYFLVYFALTITIFEVINFLYAIICLTVLTGLLLKELVHSSNLLHKGHDVKLLLKLVSGRCEETLLPTEFARQEPLTAPNRFAVIHVEAGAILLLWLTI